MLLAQVLTSRALLRLGRTGASLRHALRGGGRTVRFFYGYENPYAYLALDRVLALPDEYDLRLALYGVRAGQPDPPADLRRSYALSDARRMAEIHGIPFLATAYPPSYIVELLLLLGEVAREKEAQISFLRRSFHALWGEGRDLGAEGAIERLCLASGLPEDAPERARREPCYLRAVSENERLLRRLGHWESGTMELDGEWFWGLDRFDFLIEGLEEIGLGRKKARDES